MRTSILAGQLLPGTPLPSTRRLAGQLGLSRTTVLAAYDQLRAEGYITGRIGSGTQVAVLLPALPQTSAAPSARMRPRLSQRASRACSIPFRPEREGAPRPFRLGVPALAAFPYDAWAKALSRRARGASASQLSYQDPAGFGPLRAAIASHVAVARGVRCSAAQVIVTAGAQGAIDLALRVLCDPGDTVWLEDPGFPGALGALHAAGARLLPVPVDAEGLKVADGIERAPDARLAIVTPAHQFPTGAVMSLQRRLALLAWAGRRGAFIVEDDYDSEFRYHGRPLPALQAIDDSGRVLYVGTFSKVFAPALRLGYLVAPPSLVEALVTMRRFVDGHPPLFEQAALADLIADGTFGRHCRRMRALYGQRRAALEEALDEELGDLPFIRSQAGLHLCLRLPARSDDVVLAGRAAALGIEVQPLSRYASARRSRGLLLGFGAVTPSAMRASVRKLAGALRR